MVLTRAHLWELVRFVAVGLTSTGLYLGLLWLLTLETALSLSLRATLAYGLAIGFNYTVQKSFTFRSVRQHHHAGPRYLVVQLVGMAINSTVLWLGVTEEGWRYLPVQFGAIALTTIWSYAGQKFWAFFAAPDDDG